MSQNCEKPIKTFTIGFEGNDVKNEFVGARGIAEFFSADNYELIVDAEKAIKAVPNMIKHVEEPIADATNISSYLLSEFASKKVKVALSGEGADELMGGYVYSANLNYYSKFKYFPKIAKTFASTTIDLFPSNLISKFHNYPGNIGEEGKKRIVHLLRSRYSEREAYESFISLYSDKDILRYGIGDLRKKRYSDDNLQSYIHERNYKYWLPDYILCRVDKTSMAHSLEARVPFLDHRIVNYLSGFQKNMFDKHPLRKMMKKRIPGNTVRRKKKPFYIPITTWYEKYLKELYATYLDDSELVRNNIYPKKMADDIFNNYHKSPLINSRRLWALLTLELCNKEFIIP